MAYNLNMNFSAQKRSKTEQVLDKHGYEQKLYRGNTGVWVKFLVPIHNNLYDRIANINEGEVGPARFSGAITYHEGESTKDLFIRLGWITPDGKIL